MTTQISNGVNKIQLLTMPGCHNCAAAKKIFDEIMPDFPNVEVEEIDMTTPEGQELVQKYSIMSSPGIVINGELFSTGGVDKSKLIGKLITKAKTIMRRAIKKRPAKKKPVAVRRTKKLAAKKKRFSVPTLTKFIENPIISPQPRNGWEAWQTFNPGVILLNNRVHFLYRAIGEDGISRLGYAASEDGFHVDERFPYPVYEHRLSYAVFNYYSFASGGSFGGAEDPRIVRVNDEDILYMTYTACDNGLGVALTSIKITDFLNKKWKWKAPRLISKPDEVHKNWVLFPEKINNQYAILHSICPEISIAYRDDLEFQKGEYIESYYDGDMRRKRCWDNWLRGAGAPPIKTRIGWLLFYQAMDESDPGKYKAGVMLLSLDNPTKILHRSREPILEPEEDYENDGFKAGVVYVTGAVVKNGELLIYYGASDSYIGVAHANLEDFLEVLTKEAKPKLKLRTLKKK